MTVVSKSTNITAPHLRTPAKTIPTSVPSSLQLSKTDSLQFWHRVTVEAVRGTSPDLSARQMGVLMSVYLSDGPHTVRSLAAKLDVTKAVISRAVDRLVGYGYVRRIPDPMDKRSVLLRRTPDGIHFLSQFADIIQSKLPQRRKLRRP